MDRLNTEVQDFNSASSRSASGGKNIAYIKQSLGYPEEDIKAWLETVDYPSDIREVKESVVRDTLSILEQAGVVKKPETGEWEVETFVDSEVAKLV